MRSEYEYSLKQIFDFPVGTIFQDIQGNKYKISEQLGGKTLTYPIVTEAIVKTKFKIIKERK